MSTDFHAPTFRLVVNGHALEEDVTRSVVACSFEHTLDMASKIALTLENVGNRFTDSIMFSPGNEVDLFLGYGSELKFVGRGEIVRHLPQFPQEEVPTLDLVGYDRSHRLTRQELELSGGSKQNPKPKGKDGKAPESGTVRRGTVGSVVRDVLGKYGIELPNDSKYIAPEIGNRAFLASQKKGTPDSAFLRAMANIYGADFWVEWQPGAAPKGTSPGIANVTAPGRWVARFLRPEEYRQPAVYEFVYDEVGAGTLMSVALEFGVSASPTEVQVWVWNRGLKDWELITVGGTAAGKSERFTAGSYAKGGALGKQQAGGEAPAVESMTRVKLAVQGHSVEVVTGRRFRSKQDAATWAKVWLDRHRDGFVLARGVLPGVAELRAGQTHKLKGLGVRYSGDYFFSSVTHKFDGEAGYVCEFTARKVITE